MRDRSAPANLDRDLDWAGLAVWLLPFVVVAASTLNVNDLAYQIRAGTLMWETREILRSDVFTFTVGGEPWVNQQWGGQLVFGALFPALGWSGFVLMRAALVALAIGMTYRRTRRAHVEPLLAVGATLVPTFAAFALPGGFFLRPQLLAVPLFVATASIVERRHERPRHVALVVPIAIVWANLHGSFVLVPLLLLVATAVDVARRRSIWPLDALLTIAAASAGLLTPWGTDTYRYIVTLTSNDVVRLVAEWQPLWTHPAAAGVVLFVVVVTVVSAIRAPATVDDVEGLVTATLLLALTVSSARSVVWWALYVPPILGSLLARGRRGPTVRTEVARAAVAGLIVVALLVCVRVVVTPAERLLDDVPFGVTRSLQERPDTARRIFDLWWGSWFEFSLHDSRVFIDTRLELFPDSIWGDYATVARADPGWEAILDEWRVSAVVIPADWGSPLMSAMRTSPRWEPIYGDEQGAVFVPSLDEIRAPLDASRSASVG